MAVSRAFGNVEYDSGKKVDGIICEPEVFKIEEDDEVDFLILASGGIRDPRKDQFAVMHARKRCEPLSSQSILRKLSLS